MQHKIYLPCKNLKFYIQTLNSKYIKLSVTNTY